MRIILIRHAKAGERSTVRYPDDRLRPLTAKGRREQVVISQALYRMGVRFDVLASSPLVRARETAEILAHGMKWKTPIMEAAVLGDDFSVGRMLEWLSEFPENACIACVGHEPDLGELAAALLSDDGQTEIDFRKSGVLAVDCPFGPARGQGVLRYFLRPKMLLAIMGA